MNNNPFVLITCALPFAGLKFVETFAALRQKYRFCLRSYRPYDLSQFAVTIDESDLVSITAAWPLRFGKPERAVCSLCSLTSMHCSTPPHDMSPSHLTHAPSHFRIISSFDSADNLSDDHGGASRASEIYSYRIEMLTASSNWSDVASNFNSKQFNDAVLEKCSLQVHLTPGADINGMAVFLRWDFKNTASALDPNNGSTAEVPNIADPLVFEQQVSSTLVDFSRANPSAQKFSGCGFENLSFIVAPTTPVGQLVMYLGCLVR
jgi:hypothetical protein